ncbi:MAG: YggS family pyridoxal phosphate-dependent enzyme [Actinomycetota bacterium]
MNLVERLEQVRRRIDDAAQRSGRSGGDVTLVAVSKTFPADVLIDAVAAGVTDFGENRAQELREKLAVVGDKARWHFIGPLQTNKVRHVVGHAALVHSVDRPGLAEAIARRARGLGIVQDVLLEVNIAGDPAKHGVEPGSAVAAATAVDELDGVAVRGLMTMPPWPDSPEESRPYYKELAALGARLTAARPGAGELSMGMSRDFEVAVEEGATLVRVGEALFGPRGRR